jgi:hypothetical protein
MATLAELRNRGEVRRGRSLPAGGSRDGVVI